ncbi:MAG TPA: SMP-30/gluconolactonase/LRE family protein [Alphaproteobacteria bacterium]|jgi:sugar lactone lactonase YvrE|nr:SMP-30/gluconolactonase/LRE family protein [Alphaproteobacteria bacterium]
MSTHATQILVEGLSFPEGPRWHAGALWFSDIHAHRVYRLEPDGTQKTVAEIDDRTSGIGFLPDGRLLVVSMLDRRLVAVDADGRNSVHADMAHLSRNFINDMVVDAKGRAYVGSRNGGKPDTASDSLIFVDADGSVRTEVPDMATPNGTVITPDGSQLIIAETAYGRLRKFDIAADGSLSNRETVFEAPGKHLDGICRDEEGGIWAGGGGHGLLRISPEGELEVIEFPGRMVLATALGGPDGRTLFLATTGLNLIDNLTYIGADRTRDKDVNSDGRIEAMRVAVPGQDR